MEAVKVTRVPPPPWIDHKFIEFAISNKEKVKVTVENMNIQHANAEGIGYGSLMYRITAFAKYGNSEKARKISIIVKTALETGAMKDVFESCQAFRIESQALHEVMPQIHDKLAELEGDEFQPLAAHCYHCGQKPSDFLVLEDLAAAGFRMAQAGRPLDYEHCAAVLRAYARLHATSAFLLIRQPHYKNTFYNNMFTNQTAQKHFRSLASNVMCALANELEKCPGYEEYSQKYREFIERRLDTAYRMLEENKNQTNLPVLTHGDCWKNNIMFKYLDGEVTEVRLLDFQAANVTSPATDLQYFLYSNASEEVHRHRLGDLLRHYHNTLVGLLRRLGMEQAAQAYGMEELQRDMDRCLAAAVVFSAMSGFVLTSEKYGAEYAQAFNDVENSEQALAKTFDNPYSLSYMKYLSPIFDSKGILLLVVYQTRDLVPRQANNMELSTDTRLPPPSWINHGFIESALKTAERKKITVDSINVQYANPEGVGYGSLMFRLTANMRYEGSEQTEKKTMIVKTVLESGELLKDLIEKCDVFKIEGEMLHNVMPQVHELLAALENEEFRPIAAKCYQCGRQPAPFLVLEDLSAAGFRLAQAGQPLDLKHCEVTLRAYARLHAASAYVLCKQPHYKDTFSFHIFTDKSARQFVETMTKKLFIGLANEFDKCPGYEKYSEKYRAFADRFLDLSCERMEQIKRQTKLPVLTHGDCWKNNMMFKYTNGEVSEVRLVDFQGVSATSPASDLLYFLYSSASEDVHRHHMEDLLREYHSTLVGLLRRLGLEQQADAYTFEELKKDMDHCLVIGVHFSSASGLFLTSEKHAKEYVKAFNNPEKFDEVIVKSFRNPYTMPYMKYLTPIFDKKGIL
ncbi:uncharacterized protein LOC126156199 [Schistocerca cancellata]|uniref:uncharacterized protein LOC126156199 n=1 Tax=Schistocerca cancellata TaxID=274614 RepID=UPI002119479B|nr:uncharacterized protein LOC126156199 [Schistocerca cancellata]